VVLAFRPVSTLAADSRPYWDESVETISQDALAAYQLERLRWQVDRCFQGSALYRAKFEEVGAEPGDIVELGDLAMLSVLTKDELREDQQEHPPFGSFVVADRSSWREVHPSSGTTGVPVNTIWSSEDVETITDYTTRTLWQFGVRPGDMVQNAFAYGLWVAGMSSHYAAARIGALVVPLGTGVSTQKQIDYLRLGSTVILSTPSYALHIGEELARQGIDPEELPVRLGCFGGEAGAENEATRATIEKSLGIDAFDYYGLAEVGPTFASECTAKSGLHFAEDHILVECLDPATRQPVADGGLGVLAFTHLTRTASPMIRYWSNDYARLSHEPCACGRSHVRARGGILGRHDDLVVFKGAKFYPSQVEKVIRSLAELSPEFQIEIELEQDGVRVTSCVVVAEWKHDDVPGLVDRLRAALRSELGVTPAVRVDPAGTLPRTAFKAVRLVVMRPDSARDSAA
jgi:phenylacetate-CoA ligase